jgi:hypothetical protein
MSNIIAFPTEEAPVETECLPDHIGAKQAKMRLALFELKDAINDLPDWLKAVSTSPNRRSDSNKFQHNEFDGGKGSDRVARFVGRAQLPWKSLSASLFSRAPAVFASLKCPTSSPESW